MTRTSRTDTSPGSLESAAHFREAASHVRGLLNADYAAVATIHASSLVVRAIAGPVGTEENLPQDIAAKLGNWGPIVFDDARLISVPAMRGNRVAAILIGHSGRQRRFTSQDLERLVAYSQDVATTLDLANTVEAGLRESLLSETELFHIAKLVTIGELSVFFSHEVMSPLTSVLGNLHLIEQVLSEGDPIRVQLAGLARNAKRIESMARSMLDFGRKREKKTESCGVEEVIAEAVRFVQPRFQGPEVNCEVSVDPDCPKIVVEKWRVVHALVNLLNNAGDAIVTCHERAVKVSARNEGEFIRISVADTGPGIPPADIDRIFTPFFTTKGEQGNGLGLYITRLTVEEHRGTITVQTSESGTTFTICLPAQQDP